MTMTRDEVFGAIRTLVADSLAIKAEGITPQSRLTADLGADSLDFIDLIFLIEKKFSIKVRDGELDFFSKLDFSSPTVMKQGFLTRETVDSLKGWLPALERVPDPARVTPSQLFSLITLETLCILVEGKLRRSG
jgi:acyl carrier protein